jgi:transglutaminase-like putative cysteine protease
MKQKAEGAYANPYLQSSEIVDFHHPRVAAVADQLRAAGEPGGYGARCFAWVRDQVQHVAELPIEAVACSASQLLALGAGLCYAKSHLLVALLRAGGIASGFAYQRLSLGEPGAYCLHGLVAIQLGSGAWCRMDPRGGPRGATAVYRPPADSLVFPASEPGEYNLPEIYPEPLPQVITALRAHTSMRLVLENLPDDAVAGAP